MVAVRGKLAFNRMQPFRRTTSMSTGPRSGRKVRILVERGASAKHGAMRGLIKYGCAKLDMQVYFRSRPPAKQGGHIGMHSYTHVCCNDFYTSWQHMRAMNVYFIKLSLRAYTN